MNKTDPLKPSPSLLCKLGSIIAHADELASPSGHPFDKAALVTLMSDVDVTEWIAQMRAMAMLPVKRA